MLGPTHSSFPAAFERVTSPLSDPLHTGTLLVEVKALLTDAGKKEVGEVARSSIRNLGVLHYHRGSVSSTYEVKPGMPCRVQCSTGVNTPPLGFHSAGFSQPLVRAQGKRQPTCSSSQRYKNHGPVHHIANVSSPSREQ